MNFLSFFQLLVKSEFGAYYSNSAIQLPQTVQAVAQL